MTAKTTKINAITRLIGRRSGATIEQIQKITDWQPHSVRAALTGLRNKGYAIQRQTNTKGVSVYHLVAES